MILYFSIEFRLVAINVRFCKRVHDSFTRTHPYYMYEADMEDIKTVRLCLSVTSSYTYSINNEHSLSLSCTKICLLYFADLKQTTTFSTAAKPYVHVK